MATTNLDAADLKAVQSGGLINEDVMQTIWDISKIPLPFTDRAGSSTATNEYHEWTQDKLADPNPNNKKIDGQATNDTNDTRTGKRLGNHCQESTKTVQVSTRAQAVDTIGRSNELSYQVTNRQRELKRDVEAQMLTGQGSIEDDGATIAGQSAGIFAMIVTNRDAGTATGGGFDNTTKLYTPITPGTKRPLTETMLRDVLELAYTSNGNPDVLMSGPKVIRRISEYSFTSAARIATLTSDTGQGTDPSTAKGAVNVWVTDFEMVLTLVPNRLQPAVAAGVWNVGLFDFTYIAQSILWGVRVMELAKVGLADVRTMGIDYCLEMRNEEACAAILDIDATVPMTQA